MGRALSTMRRLPLPQPGFIECASRESEEWSGDGPPIACEHFFLALPTYVGFSSYVRKNLGQDEVPAISDAEWLVMRVLWERGAGTANDVSEALTGVRAWKPKTVQTLLRRLVDKGVLVYEKRGREFVFRPAVDERNAQMAESRSFLEKVFGRGKLAPLVAAFVEREALSVREIEELRRILDGRGGGGRR